MTSYLCHLLRHGAPETPGLLMGRTDGVPTPAGIAACVAKAAALDIEAIVSSDLSRAAQAANAIGAAKALPVTCDPRVREMDFGAWDGRAVSDIDAAAIGAFWNDPDLNPPPEGERWSGLVARVSDALRGITARPTLILTHGGAMRAALTAACGFSAQHIWAFDLPYAALLTLRLWPGEPLSGQIVALS